MESESIVEREASSGARKSEGSLECMMSSKGKGKLRTGLFDLERDEGREDRQVAGARRRVLIDEGLLLPIPSELMSHVLFHADGSTLAEAQSVSKVSERAISVTWSARVSGRRTVCKALL